MFIQNYIKKKYINYKLIKFKKLRIKLKQINDINCVIKIMKEINRYFSHNFLTTADNLLSTIYICYLIEPPNDVELQKISELQQIYNNKLNIEEYAINTLWFCIIHYIDNLPKIKKQNTWP